MIHARNTNNPPSPSADPQIAASSQVGFVVSKAVGNAVTRNRVKRRLRHLVSAQLPSTPGGVQLVVRALPAAATEPGLVAADLESGWRLALSRLVSAN